MTEMSEGVSDKKKANRDDFAVQNSLKYSTA